MERSLSSSLFTVSLDRNMATWNTSAFKAMHNRDLQLLATPEEEEAFRIGLTEFLYRIAGYLTTTATRLAPPRPPPPGRRAVVLVRRPNRSIFLNLVVSCNPEISRLRAAITAQAALPEANHVNVATPYLTLRRTFSELVNNTVDSALEPLVPDPDNPGLLKSYSQIQRTIPLNNYDEIILHRLERCLTEDNRDVFYEILNNIRADEPPLGPSLGGRRRRKSRKSKKSRKSRK